jgi:RNA polymerase sigma-70 factor (ECF subfamily)
VGEAVALETDTALLVARAQRGDEGAFRRLFQRYYDVVYAYGRMILRDADEAEDVTQDVFMRVLRLLPGYEIRTDLPFRALLLKLTRNRAIDYLRKHNARDVKPIEEILARLEPLAPAEDLTGALEELPDADLLRSLNRLPLGQRQVLVLRYVLGLPPREVAEVLDCSPKAVRNLQYRALSTLRSALTERPLPA